ncbi:MAG: D-alanyl-D-alanine carboxypeptidase family protein [Lachnospiraceae bacterium]
MKRFFCGFLACLLLVLAVPVPVLADETIPSKKLSWPEAPEITAAGAIVMEASTGTILYEKNAYEAYYPASTTKLMTSLLAIEQCPLSDIVTCSYDSIYSIDRTSSRIGLTVGEKLTMEDALYAILLASANEVSYAVAEHVGGTVDNFVAMMNKRAAELGCVNTNFKNPHGLDDEEHYTCPYDLALIAKQAITYTTFRRISGSYYHEIPATNLNVARPIGNTHQIIRKKIKYDGVFAGKAGHTSIAKNSLVTCAERDGLTLICVVMREETSDQAYTDTMALLDYGFQNFHLYELSTSGVDTKNAFPVLFEDEDALVSEVKSPLSISSTSLVLPLDADFSDVTKQVELIQGSSFTAGNNVIGEVSYYYSETYVGSAEIMYYSDRAVTLIAEPEEKSEEEAAATLSGQNAATGLSAKPETEEKDLRPLIIGIVVAVFTLILGGYLVLIELPYRKRKKEYRNRRRNNEY